jgi:hypothetical protein
MKMSLLALAFVLNQSYLGLTWLQGLIENILAISKNSADIALTNPPIGWKS